jgi:hypothetical protein
MDITIDNDHSGRKVSDWTGDFVEVGLVEQLALPEAVAEAVHKGALSNVAAADAQDAEDSPMSDEQDQQEV